MSDETEWQEAKREMERAEHAAYMRERVDAFKERTEMRTWRRVATEHNLFIRRAIVVQTLLFVAWLIVWTIKTV